MKNQIKAILIARGQTHLADYLDTLPPAQQQTLLTHLASADLSVLDAAENSAPRGHFSPLHAVSRETIARDSGLCRAAGLEAIREGKLGAVLLAGGQGSRLGFSHPKGMFNIGETRVLSIFACLMNNLRTVTEEAGVWIPLFIMTSADNRAETEEFFRENGYFGYSQAHLHFFDLILHIVSPAMGCGRTAPSCEAGKSFLYYSPNRRKSQAEGASQSTAPG